MNTTDPENRSGTPDGPVGKVYLIPITLGDTAPLEVLPISVKQAVENIDDYVAENEKTARQFIKRISAGKSQGNLRFEQLNKYTDPELIPEFLAPCFEGRDVGILSEAGCPGIADPGSEVISLAHERGIQVVPLVGPSSILMAMMASGMNGQNFAFNGYLPIDPSDRKKAIKQLEKRSREEGQTQIVMETPYRNDKFLHSLLQTLNPNTFLCVATDISLETESIATRTVRQWRDSPVELNKRPSIFLIHCSV